MRQARSALALPRWQLLGKALQRLLVCAAVWMVMWLLMALAQVTDASNAGRNSFGLVQVLRSSWSAFPPFILLSWFLSLHAWQRPQAWSSPEKQLRIFVLSMTGFAFAWLGYFWLLELLRGGKLPDAWWAFVLRNRWYSFFYDLVLASGAFFAQAFIVAKLNAREREKAWQREQTDKLRLRLLLLQGQLEPHFLFNALNSVSALVRGDDRSLALSALARISELLRYALRASKTEWVSVQDELSFMRDYLELQRLRYGESLSVRWDVSEAAWEDVACPPLMFQPLVENAIRHGLEACDGEGYVELNLARDDAGMRLTLRNPVAAVPQDRGGHGLGLAATRERLQILYGDAARLITTPQGASYKTELILPWRELHE
ncbi:sensor histidine kinase [Roseateles oligotrophus]|uniref:Histidine kinase n=1 Tax=Roseateles oligotrophus TaxID=1769250 RepID=A0ABT2YID7_9BURK|nr:histidine kinase [Roseateles oligotrophus]MCV2369814.1 histidine kinase [Roseateles oligotrophus]